MAPSASSPAVSSGAAATVSNPCADPESHMDFERVEGLPLEASLSFGGSCRPTPSLEFVLLDNRDSGRTHNHDRDLAPPHSPGEARMPLGGGHQALPYDRATVRCGRRALAL